MDTSKVPHDSYTKGLNSHSKESTEFPLVVNCAGKINITHPFLTHNTRGRLDYYLLYVKDGVLNVNIDGEIKKMTSGDFVIFPPKYKYKYGIDAKKSISYFFVHFTGSHAEEYLKALKISEGPTVRHTRYGEELSLAFSSFFAEYERGAELRDTALSAELFRIIVLLAKAFHFGSESCAVSKSLSYINENYTKAIRIPELAAAEGLSVSRYNAVFRKCVGVSPIKYMTNLRIKQACILLDSTNLTVKQIGELVGYSDNHFFSKLFKGYVGVSPLTYRRGGTKI